MELDKEILIGFRDESLGLLDELEEVVEALEEWDQNSVPTEKLKEFSQKIDRIMGAAKTLLTLSSNHTGIAFLASTSDMCKTIGYQAAALQRSSLIPIFAGFWAETVEVMREVLGKLESESESAIIVQARSATLQKRLGWLAEKVAPGNEEEKQKVLSLLKKL